MMVRKGPFVFGFFLYILVGFRGLPAIPAETLQSSAAQASNPLVEQLKSPNEKLRVEAAREIGKQHDASAVPALAAALRDPSDTVRREVIVALSQIHSSNSLDALVTATRDTDSSARVLAVKAIVGYYTGQTPGVGLAGFFRKEWRRAKSHFQPDTTRIDPGVLVDPKVVSALVQTMNSVGSVEASRQAAKGLGILVARPAVPDLVKAAHTSDEDLAREALNALSKIKDQSAGPRLADLLDSPNRVIKQDGAVTLGILRTSEVLPKLQSIFQNNPDQKTREKALEGLAYLGSPVSVPLFTKALWSDDKAMRTAAAEGLARAADPKTRAELEKAIAVEKNPGVRLAIEFALTALGKEDYLSAMVQELGSTLRGDVERAYLVELARNPKFLPKLYPYLNSRDASIRRRLCDVLMYSGDAASLEYLDRLSHDPNSEVVSEALRAKEAIRARLTGKTTQSGRASSR